MNPTDDSSSPDAPFAQRLRQAVALRDAPPALVHAALALWSTRSAPAASLGAVLRRVQAVLRFDSAIAPVGMLATRSAGAGPRHLLFSAEGRDIDLRVTATQGSGFGLAGQVLGPDETGQIDVSSNDKDGLTVVASTTLNELGEFHIANLPAGRYVLTLSLGDDGIVLPAIDVGTDNT